MTTGLSTVNLANVWLDTLDAGHYVKLHTGDPGAAGTANPSANTTRVILDWAAASLGSKSIQAAFPAWLTWAVANETITHISVWDNLTAGSFKFSGILTLAKPMTAGDNLTLGILTFALLPLAA